MAIELLTSTMNYGLLPRYKCTSERR